MGVNTMSVKRKEAIFVIVASSSRALAPWEIKRQARSCACFEAYRTDKAAAEMVSRFLMLLEREGRILLVSGRYVVRGAK